MAASFGSGPCWWDREVDGTGKAIRPDVRQAGHEIWQTAQRRVRLKCGDDAEAGWLMECAVERISRYLDRKDQPLFSKDVRWLLLSAFCRLLRRYTKKLERLKLVGDVSDLAELKAEDDWASRVNGRADLTKMLRGLSAKGCRILALRLAGFGWREIAANLEISEVAARRSFWREIRRLQSSGSEKPGPGSEVG